MKSILHVTFALLLSAVLTALPVHAQNSHPADIVDTAVAAGQFEALAAVLNAAGLVETLKGDGPFTVFAPTDAAFEKLPRGTVEALLKPENRDQLVAVLTYHVVPGRVTARQVARLDDATTVSGQRVAVTANHDGIFIDEAEVISADVRASNGIIHVIDEVLMPETANIPAVASEAGQFSTLLAAVNAAGLGEALMGDGPFTVFAPTDAAFAKLPGGTVETLLKPENREQLATILKFHVVPGRVYADIALAESPLETLAGDRVRVRRAGDRVLVNKAEVVAANVEAANGVIHVIDTVLLPDAPMSDASPAQIIQMAINRGVPLYNHGQHAACAAIYELAATAVLAMEGVPASAQRSLRRALGEMPSLHSAAEQAWALRHGLDDAASALRQATMQMSSRH